MSTAVESLEFLETLEPGNLHQRDVIWEATVGDSRRARRTAEHVNSFMRQHN